MTAARPTSVVVMGHPYAVEEKVRDDVEDGAMGATHHRSLTIRIATEQAASQQRDTLLHEVIHAILNMTDLDGKRFDERFVNVFTTAFLDTLRRNPDLAPYLLEDRD